MIKITETSHTRGDASAVDVATNDGFEKLRGSFKNFHPNGRDGRVLLEQSRLGKRAQRTQGLLKAKE